MDNEKILELIEILNKSTLTNDLEGQVGALQTFLNPEGAGQEKVNEVLMKVFVSLICIRFPQGCTELCF